MSATNDPFVERYKLPGVVNPILPDDIVNKAYADNIPQTIMGRVQLTPISVSNSTVPVPTSLAFDNVPAGTHAVHLFAQMSGANNTANMRCNFALSAGMSMRWQFTEKNAQPATITDNDVPIIPMNNSVGRVEITGYIHHSGVGLNDLIWLFAQGYGGVTPSTLTLEPYSFMTLTKLS